MRKKVIQKQRKKILPALTKNPSVPVGRSVPAVAAGETAQAPDKVPDKAVDAAVDEAPAEVRVEVVVVRDRTNSNNFAR